MGLFAVGLLFVTASLLYQQSNINDSRNINLYIGEYLLYGLGIMALALSLLIVVVVMEMISESRDLVKRDLGSIEQDGFVKRFANKTSFALGMMDDEIKR